MSSSASTNAGDGSSVKDSRAADSRGTLTIPTFFDVYPGWGDRLAKLTLAIKSEAITMASSIYKHGEIPEEVVQIVVDGRGTLDDLLPRYGPKSGVLEKAESDVAWEQCTTQLDALVSYLSEQSQVTLSGLTSFYSQVRDGATWEKAQFDFEESAGLTMMHNPGFAREMKGLVEKECRERLYTHDSTWQSIFDQSDALPAALRGANMTRACRDAIEIQTANTSGTKIRKDVGERRNLAQKVETKLAEVHMLLKKLGRVEA